jgi:1-phosphofructokinase
VPRVLTVTLNPAIDMRMRFAQVQLEVLNRAQTVELEPSGKGINVARALARQGFAVTAVAMLGGPFGAMLEQLLEPELEPGFAPESTRGLRLLRIPITGETRCNIKVLDLQRSAISELNAPGPKVNETELEELRQMLRHEVNAGDLVVLSGSLPTGLPVETHANLIRELSSLGAKTYFDADGAAFQAGLAAKPFLIKPNRLEAETLLGIKIQSPPDALAAARRLQSLGAQHVVLSLGADGALFASSDESVFARPPSVQIHNTVGSGDALLSGVVAARLQNLSWSETARYASAVAAARVASSSLEFPSTAEIQNLLGYVQINSIT